MLSGGERRRLALAVTVASGANFLVLDEPTNHLDLESREALEAALDAFPGTVLLVSHDRALLDAIAERTLAIEDGELRAYDGGWAELLRVREEREARAKPEPPVERAKPAPKPAGCEAEARRSSELELIEAEIAAARGRGGGARDEARRGLDGRRRARRAQAQPRRAHGAPRALGAALRAGPGVAIPGYAGAVGRVGILVLLVAVAAAVTAAAALAARSPRQWRSAMRRRLRPATRCTT